MSLLSLLLVGMIGADRCARDRGVPRVLAAIVLHVGVAGVVGVVGLGATTAHAQDCDPTEVAKLLAHDGAAGDFFGNAVALDGGTIVIGAPKNDHNGMESGSAYVYHFNGSDWVQEAKLTPSDGASVDQFGRAVSISGETILVGAYLDDDHGTNSGSAYVFKRSGSGWFQEAKLLAADGAAGDFFGRSVSISGDTAVIGARGDDDNGTDAGSAYVFRFDGTSWTQETKIIPADGDRNDEFGYSVSMSAGSVIIGAVFDNDNGGDSGSAYIYRFDGASWIQVAKLVPPDGTGGDQFGWSVSIYSDTALIGAARDISNGTNLGSAYIYHNDGNNWVQQAKLLASDGTLSELFGYAVSISDDTAVIGAPFHNDGGNLGAAYVFHFDGLEWVQETILPIAGEIGGVRFGWAVSVSGDTTVAGAHFDNDNGGQAGSAYIYDISGVCPADLTGDCEVDTIDFLAFLGAWSIGDPLADWNGDGDINTLDFLAYLGDWAAGCP